MLKKLREPVNSLTHWAGAILAGTIGISAKPQHFPDDRILRRLRVEVKRADGVLEDRITELIPAIQVESTSHQITQGFDLSGTRMRHEALDQAIDICSLPLMIVHGNFLDVFANLRGLAEPTVPFREPLINAPFRETRRRETACGRARRDWL